MISVKIHKPSISLLSSNKIIRNEKTVHNYLITKYSKFEYSYSLVCITNLIFNEQCRIVARFKDFLILDDMTEFLRRFYTKKELKRRLNKIFNFYEGYSKIFPNYMILPENKYLYRNIRKKQKMIDAFNQIKKEEEENRNSLKKEEKGEMVIFNRSIQESINRYHPSGASFLFNSIISGFKKKNNGTDNDSNWNSLISISINKINDIMFSNNNNSFDCGKDEVTLNSENSLVNIVQLLNKKYDNKNDVKFSHNHNQNGQLDYYKNNLGNEKSKRMIKKNYDKIKKEKNIINKDTNSSNQNKTRLNKKKVEKLCKDNTNNNNNIILNITTPPKTSSPGQNKLTKKHNHQKSALNNNKKFISHKQAISVSNNNANNTIKIINNINNIIINDPNINKDMVININTNYFELNNTNLNTFNRINNNNNRNINNKNILIKKVKINKSKNKEKSIKTGKEVIITKKINHEQKSLINNTLEEKRMHTYNNQILNFENHHYNSNSNNIENHLINNNFINIHNNTISHINTAKTNKTSLRKHNNENRIIKGITEYRSININNNGKNGSINKKRDKYNYLKNDINKKAYTINVENRRSQNKQLKKLEILIGSDSKNNIQNKKASNALKTDGNLNYYINSNYIKNYYNDHDLNNNSYNINLNDKNDYNGIKSTQIRSKLNKKILPRKQKTNSLHINKKNKNNFFSSLNNNYRISKDLNFMKMNNQGNNNLMKDHIKSVTQVNLDSEYQKNPKILSYKGSKEVSKSKPKKISAKEMQEKYHKFMLGNKIIHGSYDTSNRMHLFKKFHYLYNNNTNNNNNNNTINNTTNISHKKILDKKSPFKFNNIINTPANILMDKNSNTINSFNTIGHSYNNYEKTYKGKIQLHKKEPINDKNRNLFYRINGLKNKIFISDTNNKKMKYVKK